MNQIEYRFKAQGTTLQKYMQDRSRLSCIIGPLGSGKTYQTCQKKFKLICEQEPDEYGVRKTRWIDIRNTYSDLLSTTIKDWLSLFADLGKYKAGGMSPPSHHIKDVMLEDGTRLDAEIIFLALDRDDSIKKLRGTQVTGFWLNELKELAKSILDMADLRHGRYPNNPTWHGIIADTNAPDQDHWLYNLIEDVRPEGWSFFKQPGGVIRAGLNNSGKVHWVQNPAAENIVNLPPGYYTKGLLGKSDDWISVNLANEYGFVSDGKAIYPEYSDNLHCTDFDIIPGEVIYRGWDFGTPACVLLQYTKKGRLIIFREFCSDKTMGIDAFSDHVINSCADLKNNGYSFIDVGDPAGMARSQQKDEVTCFNILWDKGINIEPGQQNLTARLDSVKYFLNRLADGRPCFYVHPTCKMLRKGFQGAYCYRRIKVVGEYYMDKPDKNKYSHCQDALQYVASYIRSGYIDDSNDHYDDYYDQKYKDQGTSSIGGY